MREAGQRPGLYVHVPFCTSVCPYCDFAVTLAGEERRRGWERAVIDEASMYRGAMPSADTVYLGGGTPSSIHPDRLRRVLFGLRRELDLSEDATVHLEVNPEHVDPRRAHDWADMGVRFASVGLQSLDEDALGFLGRKHSAAQGRRAISLLLEAGVPTVSADLIFGLPGQTAVDWRRQLEALLHLGISHVSCYQLTIHRGTIFGRRRDRGVLQEMCEADQAALYLLTHDVLGSAGFEAYEVSNFARPGHRSRHNQKYWTGAPYLGLGPSAHSYDGRAIRWWNISKVRLWQRQVNEGVRPVSDSEKLRPEESAFEAVMLGLRLADGVDLGAVEDRWGVAVDVASWATLERFADDGLVVMDRRHVRPTPQGMAVADALARSIGFSPEPDGDDDA